MVKCTWIEHFFILFCIIKLAAHIIYIQIEQYLVITMLSSYCLLAYSSTVLYCSMLYIEEDILSPRTLSPVMLDLGMTKQETEPDNLPSPSQVTSPPDPPCSNVIAPAGCLQSTIQQSRTESRRWAAWWTDGLFPYVDFHGERKTCRDRKRYNNSCKQSMIQNPVKHIVVPAVQNWQSVKHSSPPWKVSTMKSFSFPKQVQQQQHLGLLCFLFSIVLV